MSWATDTVGRVQGNTDQGVRMPDTKETEMALTLPPFWSYRKCGPRKVFEARHKKVAIPYDSVSSITEIGTTRERLHVVGGGARSWEERGWGMMCTGFSQRENV